MHECITVMETMFRDLTEGRILQPLRSLMWLPDRSGLLGMMPGYAEGPNIIGIKLITIFHANGPAGLPSHQGIIILFEATHGQPLLLLDAAAITAIRTAAASAVATRLLARENATTLAIIGTGEQAERHIESNSRVRNIDTIYLWGRNPEHAKALKARLADRYPIFLTATARAAIEAAQANAAQTSPATARAATEPAAIICTVTSAPATFSSPDKKASSPNPPLKPRSAKFSPAQDPAAPTPTTSLSSNRSASQPKTSTPPGIFTGNSTRPAPANKAYIAPTPKGSPPPPVFRRSL